MFWMIVGISLIGGLVLLFYMFSQAKLEDVTSHEVSVSRASALDDEVTLYFISDVHRRILSNRLLDKVDRTIDLVIIGGDFFEEGVPESRIEKNIKQLQKLSPYIYFVFGNHDHALPRKKLRRLFRSLNVSILENSSVVFKDLPIRIHGITDTQVRRALVPKAVKEKVVHILVAHDPAIWYTHENARTYDLILSGHTHGGQIRLFGFGIRPPGGVFPHQRTWRLISNGYGTRKIPLRLGAKAETHVITIRRGPSGEV